MGPGERQRGQRPVATRLSASRATSPKRPASISSPTPRGPAGLISGAVIDDGTTGDASGTGFGPGGSGGATDSKIESSGEGRDRPSGTANPGAAEADIVGVVRVVVVEHALALQKPGGEQQSQKGKWRASHRSQISLLDRPHSSSHRSRASRERRPSAAE